VIKPPTQGGFLMLNAQCSMHNGGGKSAFNKKIRIAVSNALHPLCNAIVKVCVYQLFAFFNKIKISGFRPKSPNIAHCALYIVH